MGVSPNFPPPKPNGFDNLKALFLPLLMAAAGATGGDTFAVFWTAALLAGTVSEAAAVALKTMTLVAPDGGVSVADYKE